ncbi:DNA-binding response regulator [Pararobbsia silviterrae]|uniref:DNA-binding response regulator n=1 Tax=Pararobbsia silviterrae TaxID=1792498 RepID=A0A494Y0W6_9BURK|nr:DNA-binding response regulator [Pararobbsia silviterrae]
MVIADDHPVVLAAVSDAFAQHIGCEVVATASSGDELVQILQRDLPDLVVTDLVMHSTDQSSVDGLRLISMLRRSYPTLPLVAFTMIASGGMYRELSKLRVAGIVSKEESLTELVQMGLRALSSRRTLMSPKVLQRVVANGHREGEMPERSLSPRELEVVRLFSHGLTVTEIARRLSRAVPTVATQKRSAMRKLNLTNHVDLVKYANDIGLV